MSKAGIDARATLNPDNFLLIPARKFEQIIKAGEIYIPPSTSGVNLPYSEAFTKYPYVFFMASVASGAMYYPHSFDISLPAYSNHVNRTLVVRISIWGDKVTVQNTSDTYGLYMQYFVLHRSITG